MLQVTDTRRLRGGATLVLMLLLVGGCASSAGTRSTQTTAQRDTTTAAPVAAVPQTVPVQTERPTPWTSGADTIRAGRFDSGKMWTFDAPPTEYLREAYGFTPDAAWFERARLGAVRIPGCTASFVSPNGLLLTNHHCSRGYVPALTRTGENLLDDGFYAASNSDERRAEGLYAEQLIALEDVTAEMDAALEGKQTDAERAAARQAAIEGITRRVRQQLGGREQDYTVQVVSLYAGGRYSAYTFRRYHDVRLVLLPELQLAYFGGDPDNFTYPRYDLDLTFWRVYGDDGRPLQTEHYFRWSTAGTKEGDPVFVVGNPGSTSRLQTVAQLEYRRDVQERNVSALIDARVEALRAYVEAHPEDQVLQNQLFSLMNSQKFYQGSLRTLRDDEVLARRRDTERQFVEALRKDAALQARYGTLVDRIAAIQEQRRGYAREQEAFLGLTPTSSLGSAVLRRGMLAHTYLTRQASGAAADALAQLREQLLHVADQPREVQAAYVTHRFETLLRLYGADDAVVRQVLGGRTPEAVARELLDRSALATAEGTAAALERGTLSMDDPAVRFAQAVAERYQAFQSANAGLTAQEQEIASQIGRAKYEVYGTALPPDATFSLRIADGVVKSFPYNGTLAPAYTTYFGMYDRYHGFQGEYPWTLPERWLKPASTFDLRTPMNLVSTNDIIGGNSGSPLLNRDLELVGLVFDSNIEGLAAAFIYLPERSRTVSVDARGILEALDDVYDADRVVQELTTGRLVPSEADADESAQGGR